MMMIVLVVHVYDLVILEVGVSIWVEDEVEVGPHVVEGVVGAVVGGVVGVVVEGTLMLGYLTESKMCWVVCGSVRRVMLTSSL